MHVSPDIAAVADEADFDGERLGRLSGVFRADVERGVIPGAVVLVARHGKIAYHEAFGFRDRAREAAMRRDSIFRGASMTKPLVAVAAMMLVEAGTLQLFAPISKYLPAFAGVQVGVEEVDRAGARTLRLEPPLREPSVQDLLRHTAGFTYGPFGDSLVQRMYREANAADPRQSNAEMAATLARLPLAYQPGSTFEYGMSLDVLGAIVEAISGSDLREYVRERIAAPLAMSDTDFILAERDVDRLAEPHLDTTTGNNPLRFLYDPARPPAWFSGGGGILTTAGDYARFAQMLLDGGTFDGGRLLSRKIVELMTCDHLPPGVGYGPFTRALGITAPLPELGQGFGLSMVVRKERGRNPNPGSIGDFSWSGISGTYWWADPREHLVAVLMLAAPTLRVHYRTVMRDLVYAALR
ncbi:MAG: beta-lactamase family protein [Candidatus Eremiobacteraeota bacterium]|nr:beta-lactamase family protein [Candidatus Eremiobacteraeota bacterium]